MFIHGVTFNYYNSSLRLVYFTVLWCRNRRCKSLTWKQTWATCVCFPVHYVILILIMVNNLVVEADKENSKVPNCQGKFNVYVGGGPSELSYGCPSIALQGVAGQIKVVSL